MVAQVLARQAPEDHDGQRPEEGHRQQPLPARLAAGNQRGEEDAGRKVGRRDEEDGGLEVPGAGQVVREPPRQVDSEETAGFDHVVDGRTADQVLEEEEDGDHEEEPRCHPLGGGQGHLPGAQTQLPLLGLVPADRPRVAAVEPEHDADAPKQGHERQALHMIASPVKLFPTRFVGRPAVCVRVGLARPAGHRCPRRPCDKRSDLAGVVGIRDHRGLRAPHR